MQICTTLSKMFLHMMYGTCKRRGLQLRRYYCVQVCISAVLILLCPGIHMDMSLPRPFVCIALGRYCRILLACLLGLSKPCGCYEVWQQQHLMSCAPKQCQAAVVVPYADTAVHLE